MGRNVGLSECFTEIDEADTMEALSDVISKIRNSLGLAHLVFHVTHAPQGHDGGPLLLLTYPSEWIKTYTEKNYFQIDPVVTTGTTSFLPMDWSNLDWTNKQSSEFLKESARHGVGRCGVTFTIRGPRSERSLFTATSHSSDEQWKEFRGTSSADLNLIGLYLHDRAMQITGLRKVICERPLSRRERQCLELVAQGFAPKQISHRLSLSESAVRLYLNWCRRKLHTTSTSHAVALAISGEFISP